MADNIWTGNITKDTDWGGDESTGFLPVSGGVIQQFIKSQFQEDQQLINSLQEQLSSRPKIVVLTAEEWQAKKTAGTVESGTLYAIKGSSVPPASDDQTITVNGDTMTIVGSSVSNDTLSMIGQYNPNTEELIIIL